MVLGAGEIGPNLDDSEEPVNGITRKERDKEYQDLIRHPLKKRFPIGCQVFFPIAAEQRWTELREIGGSKECVIHYSEVYGEFDRGLIRPPRFSGRIFCEREVAEEKTTGGIWIPFTVQAKAQSETAKVFSVPKTGTNHVHLLYDDRIHIGQWRPSYHEIGYHNKLVVSVPEKEISCRIEEN